MHQCSKYSCLSSETLITRILDTLPRYIHLLSFVAMAFGVWTWQNCMLTHPSSGAISHGHLVWGAARLPVSGERSRVRCSAPAGSSNVRHETKQTLTTTPNMAFSTASSLIFRLERRRRHCAFDFLDPMHHTDDSTSRPHIIHISKHHLN